MKERTATSLWRPRHYHDFLLRIASAGLSDYEVQLLASPYGVAESPFDFPFTGIDISDMMLGLERLVQDAGGLRGTKTEGPSPREVGRRLFDALITGPVLEKYLLSLGRVESSAQSGLRMRLLFDLSKPFSFALFNLPWEFLYSDKRRDFLARDPRTPFIRHLQIPRPGPPAFDTRELRILILMANPRGTAPLSHGEEVADLREILREFPHVTLSLLDKPTLPRLREFLHEGPVDVLHFIGHAQFDPVTGKGTLLFEDSDCNPHPVPGEALAETLKSLASPRFVVLNACETAGLARQNGADPYTNVATVLLLGGTPAVIAMQYPISDTAAVTFSRVFYKSLARGLTLDAAVAEARLGIHLQDPDSWEWVTPSLLLGFHDTTHLAEPLSARHSITSVQPTALSEFDSVSPELKVNLKHRFEKQVRDFPDNAQFSFGLGLSYLDLRLYDMAIRSMRKAMGKGLNEANLMYYLALAVHEGKRPRALGRERVREIESFLAVAVQLDDSKHHYFLLWALVKYDYYLANGLRSGAPTLEELINAASRLKPDLAEIKQLLNHVPLASNPLVQPFQSIL